MSSPLYPGKTNPPTAQPDPGEAMSNGESVPHHFAIVAAKAVFAKGDEIKHRDLNVMLETDNAWITRSDMDQVNMGVLGRLQAENGVQADDLKDIVILGISRLGMMPRHVFYGMSAEEFDTAMEEAETDTQA